MIIHGPAKILKQLYEHYSRPKQNKLRELVLVSLIIVLDLMYPAGLLCLLWMPVTLRWVWLGYQAFVAIAMHVYRFHTRDMCCSTQECIGQALLKAEGGEICLLRDGKHVLMAKFKYSACKKCR